MSVANLVVAPPLAGDLPGLPGRYALGERLGAGASGETFSAIDVTDGGACVVKVLASGQTARQDAVAEFEGLATLAHPGIVRVRDIGRLTDGRLFLITDRVVGPGIESVASIVDDARRRAVLERAALDLAGALAHLHGRGLAHGDICPANVRLSSGPSKGPAPPAMSSGGLSPPPLDAIASGFSQGLDLPRAVLIDFGLAGPPMSGQGGARGTLGYAAPEALTGTRSPVADLFALGATLFEAWTGAAPFGRGLPAVQRMLVAGPPALSSIRPGLGPDWDRLIARLLAADPVARPRSARELLRDLLRIAGGSSTPTDVDLGVPYPEGDPLQGVVVGRRAERAALRTAIERLAEGAAASSTLFLAGALGSGRRTLFELVMRDAAVAGAAGATPAIEVWRGDVDALESLVGGPDTGADPAHVPSQVIDHARAAEVRMARVAEALEAKAKTRPLCVWLEGGARAAAFASFWSGAPPSGRAMLVVPVEVAPELPFAETVTLGPLGAADVEALVAAAVETAPPAAAIATIVRAAQGNAAVAGILARRLVTAMRAGEGDLSVEAGVDLDGVLAQSFGGLSADAKRIVLALALAEDDPRPVAGLDAEAFARAVAAGRRAGWIEMGIEGASRLPSAAHSRAALAGVDPELGAELADRALERLTPGDARRADALVVARRPAEAAAALRSAAAIARGTGAMPRAALLLERAQGLAAVGLDFDEQLALLTGFVLLGRYEDALRVLERAIESASDGSERAICCERQAWLLTRRGDLEAARAALERGLAEDAGSDRAAELQTRLGRLLVTSGRFKEALGLVEPLLAAPAGEARSPAARAVALEAAVLAHAYLGEFPAARTHLEVLDGRTIASGEDGLCPSEPIAGGIGRGGWGPPPSPPDVAIGPGRREYLAALVAQLAGEENVALESYRRAYEMASAQGDVHTVAAVALNLGGLLGGQGLYGEALAASERAVRELGRLGAEAELATALVNAANLFVEVGDPAAARRALDRARARVSKRQVALTLAPATFVEGDLVRRGGEPRAAAALYRSAAAAFADNGQPHRAAAALASAAEALAAAGLPEEGRRALAEAQSLTDGEENDIARAKGALALADGGGDEPPAALAERLEALARRTRTAARRPQAWRLAVLAARLAERGGAPGRVRSARELARSIFEEVRMATPEHHRPGLEQDPDALWLAGSNAAGGDPASASRALAAEGRLRRLLRINKRLNSELRLPRLLEMIVDTVIELTDAERGFLLLEDDGGTLEVKVARNIDQRSLDTAEFELSRSIARQAAAGGEPIVTIDAAGDARFREAVSVSDLHLRSVLAVPLAIKGRVAGTIYVDHRLRKGAFNQEDVRLVLDFAEQAAIALENTRLLAELRRRERQVEALNRRLEVELSARREELSGIKQELRVNREALAVRYDYRNIIGRTPRMLDLFRLLDRITDTTLPVVIQGESGTGKELVARAIHSNGPRRDRPFVAENCAAIPETLLESTLFGYVRGAFTGADHDTRGLFEIADGGTLFLDEVGEMSPAMQGKLLRVLQEGELRRVGSERTRKVDVRIVTATNRDLTRLVEEGKFRRDLFFRLNVAPIALPALRERRDDIPLMVEHFLGRLAKAAGRPPKPIDPAALARLVAYRWPGNVRELENEITRADALSGDRIGADDLAPHVAAAGDPGAVAAADPDSLLLKPRVERLERSLLREAIGRAGGNQTRAADLLGLSRFGLQKKLKRYNF